MGVLDQRFEKEFHDFIGGLCVQLGAQIRYLAADVRPVALLRDRDDRVRPRRASTSRRFGAEVFRPSPRQVRPDDCCGATVTLKMAPVLKRVWDQMPDPKWWHFDGARARAWVGPSTPIRCFRAWIESFPSTVYVVGCPPAA